MWLYCGTYILPSKHQSDHTCISSYHHLDSCLRVMNDSTPLLGQVVDHIPPTDSDLFLRVVESPWSFLSSRHLFFVRLFLAFSMTLFLSVYLVFEVLAGRGKIVAFRLMDLAWIGQCIYLWLTSVSLTVPFTL